MKYRPEIDGLRAIAVFAVILYHAEIILYGFNPFKGGFIGVDVFFVISGYLITSIISKQLNEGTFSILEFYERRARRILPVLFTVMVTSVPFAWLYMLPKAVKEYSGSILSSLLFVSNFWFYKEDSYWAEPSALKPFLHTWSLSVEEQYYLFFPLLILLLWRFIPKHILTVFSLLLVLSLLFAYHTTNSNPDFAFYMIATRIWELLAGALLAKLEFKKGRLVNKIYATFMPAIGLLLIMFAVVFFDQNTRHPSLATTMPVIGTILIICFCRKGEFVTDILSNRLVVNIGLISYGLYLWHYPIFAFSSIKNLSPSLFDKFGWIIISLILAWFTHIVIEKPFRDRERVPKKPFLLFITVLFICVSVPVGFAYQNNGQWGRFAEWQLRFIGEGRSTQGTFDKYMSEYYKSHVDAKTFKQNSQKKLLIIGDSYSKDFTNVLHEAGYLDSDSMQVSAYYIPSICQNVPNNVNFLEHVPKKNWKLCTDVYHVGDIFLDIHIRLADAVILVSAWNEFTSSHVRELQDYIYELGVNHVMVVGTKNIPTITTEEIVELNFEEIVGLKKEVEKETVEVIKKFQYVPLDNYLDIHQLVCGDTESCQVSTPKGFLISYDGKHLTREGAIYVGGLLKENKEFNQFWTDALDNSK